MHAEDESDEESAGDDQPGHVILDDEEEEAGAAGQAQDGSDAEESLDGFIEEDDAEDTGAPGCEPLTSPNREGMQLKACTKELLCQQRL